MSKITEFEKKYNAKMEAIQQRRIEQAKIAEEGLTKAKREAAALVLAKNNAMDRSDLEGAKAASESYQDAVLTIEMYQKQLDALRAHEEPGIDEESAALFNEAKALKAQRAADTLEKIVELLTKVEILGHTFCNEMEAVDVVASNWNGKICEIEGFQGYYSGHQIPCDDGGLRKAIWDVINIRAYRVAHGHEETIFGSNDDRWMVEI